MATNPWAIVSEEPDPKHSQPKPKEQSPWVVVAEEPEPSFTSRALNFLNPVEGAKQLGRGISDLLGLPPSGPAGFTAANTGVPAPPRGAAAEPVRTQAQDAISDIMEGAGRTALPLVAIPAVTNPISTGLAVAGGVALSKGGEALSRVMGGTPSTQRLVGNVASIPSAVSIGKNLGKGISRVLGSATPDNVHVTPPTTSITTNVDTPTIQPEITPKAAVSDAISTPTVSRAASLPPPPPEITIRAGVPQVEPLPPRIVPADPAAPRLVPPSRQLEPGPVQMLAPDGPRQTAFDPNVVETPRGPMHTQEPLGDITPQVETTTNAQLRDVATTRDADLAKTAAAQATGRKRTPYRADLDQQLESIGHRVEKEPTRITQPGTVSLDPDQAAQTWLSLKAKLRQTSQFRKLRSDEQAEIHQTIREIESTLPKDKLDAARREFQAQRVAERRQGIQDPINAPRLRGAISQDVLARRAAREQFKTQRGDPPPSSPDAPGGAAPPPDAPNPPPNPVVPSGGALTPGRSIKDWVTKFKEARDEIKDKTVRNFSKLEHESEKSWVRARANASPTAQARVAMATAIPRMERALAGTDISVERVLGALDQSKIMGVRERYFDLADTIMNTPDKDVADTWGNAFKDIVEGLDHALGSDNADTIETFIKAQDFPAVKEHLSSLFEAIPEKVADVEGFNPGDLESLMSSPAFNRALAIYKSDVESKFAQVHALNEGFFSDALGPLNTYKPLTDVKTAAADALRSSGGGSYTNPIRPDFEIPDNPSNYFAAGLGKYTPSVEALRNRLTSAIRANQKGGLFRTLMDEGLAQELPAGAQHIDTIDVNGVPEPAVILDMTGSQISRVGGKYVRLPAKKIAVPKWLAEELEPIVESGKPFSPGVLDRIANSAVGATLIGPADNVHHIAAVTGSIMNAAPWLDKSALNRSIAGIPGAQPLVRLIQMTMKVATALRGDENKIAAELSDMAEMGYLPGRYASVTADPKLAKSLGIELVGPKADTLSKKIDLSAFLYGPRGVDVRARLAMFRVAKSIYPDHKTPEFAKFMDQLIDYNRVTQAAMLRSLKGNVAGRAIAPFVSAGTTMLNNGIRALIPGATPLPGSDKLPFSKTIMHRVEQQWTGGVIGGLASWMLLSKAATGKWPWEDEESRLMEIKAPDSFRKSEMGKQLWGDNDKPGYISMRYVAPIPVRGLRASGLKGAHDVAKTGGSGTQVRDEMLRTSINALAHPFTSGPAINIGAPLIFGKHAYMSRWRDVTGRQNPALLPAVPEQETAKKQFLANAAAAAEQVIPAFEGLPTQALRMAGSHVGEEHEVDRGNKLVQLFADWTFPGLRGPAYSAAETRKRLARQEKARLSVVRAQKRRENK